MKKVDEISTDSAYKDSCDNSYEDTDEFTDSCESSKPNIPDDKCPKAEKAKFCCVVTVPKGVKVAYKAIKVVVASDKNLIVKPGGSIKKQICGCKIKLNTIKICGCVKVFVSLGIKDNSGNIGYVCSSTCAFLNDLKFTCCGDYDEDYTNIKFKPECISIKKLCSCEDGGPVNSCESVYQISGKLDITCKTDSCSD